VVLRRSVACGVRERHESAAGGAAMPRRVRRQRAFMLRREAAAVRAGATSFAQCHMPARAVGAIMCGGQVRGAERMPPAKCARVMLMHYFACERAGARQRVCAHVCLSRSARSFGAVRDEGRAHAVEREKV